MVCFFIFQLFTKISKITACPGKYLEIFARRNNLRDKWVSIGLEL